MKRIPQTWYHISGLNPDKEYNFRVQAENDFGTSKPTPAVYMPRMAGKGISDFEQSAIFVSLICSLILEDMPSEFILKSCWSQM